MSYSENFLAGRTFAFASLPDVWDFSLPHLYLITAYFNLISRNRTLGGVACLLGIKAYLEATQNYHLHWKGSTALMCFAYLYGAIKLGELGIIMLTHREADYDNQDINVKNPTTLVGRLQWSLGAAANLRCIGFKCGKRQYSIKKASKRAILWPALFKLGLVDIVTTILHHLTVYNGNLTFAARPWWQQYSITALVAFSLFNLFQGLYGVLQFVGIYGLSMFPSMWPPMLLKPWTATSVQQFWSKEWHSVFRRIFVFYTKLIVEPVSRRCKLSAQDESIFTTMTVFFMSALLHVSGLYLFGRTLFARTLLFFVLQGPVIMLEGAIQIDRNPILGWLWTYGFLLTTAGPVGMIADVVDYDMVNGLLIDGFFHDVSIAARIVNFSLGTNW